MPSLYNCRHDGDQYRITKFNTDWNVEASYLCDLVACECPAGHRPKCRHREMLPKFIQRGHVGDEWFYDHDRGGWVQGASREIEPSQSDEYLKGITNREPELSLTIATEITLPADATPDEVAEAFGNLLGGFPDWCLADGCPTPDDCILNGCAKGHGQPPRVLASTEFTNPLVVSGAESSGVVASTVGQEDKGSIPSALPSTTSGPTLEPSPIPTIRRRV